MRLRQTSHALLAAVLEHTGSAIIATHPNGVISTFNPAAEALLGYMAAEVVDRMTPAAFFAPVELNQRTATFLGPFPLAERTGNAVPAPATIAGAEPAAAIATRRLSDTEPWTFVRKDGVLLAVWLRAAEVRAADGALLG